MKPWSVSKPNPMSGGHPEPVTDVTVPDLPESTSALYRELFARKMGSCTVGWTTGEPVEPLRSGKIAMGPFAGG